MICVNIPKLIFFFILSSPNEELEINYSILDHEHILIIQEIHEQQKRKKKNMNTKPETRLTNKPT